MADDYCGMCEVHAAMLQSLSRQLDEAQRERDEAVADARRWRNHVETADACHSHKCRRCAWGYTPGAGTSEDCPACGFDGIGDAAIAHDAQDKT